MDRKYDIRPDRLKKIILKPINKENKTPEKKKTIDAALCELMDISLKSTRSGNVSCQKSMYTLRDTVQNLQDCVTSSEIENENDSFDIIEGSPLSLVPIKTLATTKSSTIVEESSSDSVENCVNQMIVEESGSLHEIGISITGVLGTGSSPSCFSNVTNDVSIPLLGEISSKTNINEVEEFASLNSHNDTTENASPSIINSVFIDNTPYFENMDEEIMIEQSLDDITRHESDNNHRSTSSPIPIPAHQFQQDLTSDQITPGTSTNNNREPAVSLEGNLNLSDEVVADPNQLHQEITPGTSSNNNQEPAVFLEDDLNLSDDSVADPNWLDSHEKEEKRKNTSDSEENKTDVEENKKRRIKTTRWSKRKEEQYDRNKQKVLRGQCLPYKDYKKRWQPPKSTKPVDCSNCRLHCSENFSEDERTLICKSYWGLADYKRQKDFLLSNIKECIPQRRLTKAKRKRDVSRYYYLKKQNEKIRVCEKFFKATLSISNGPILKAFKGAGLLGNFEGQDNRGNHEPHNKTSQEDENYVKQHIESFPTMESHYCRNTSSKKYLENNLSIPKMYELYEEKCKKDCKPPVSVNVYRRIFCTQYNLDFHKTKKDQCLTCNKYQTAKTENSTDLADWKEKYDRHIILKDQCQKAKELDKIRANEDESFSSITMDLQKVMHMPHSNVSLLYYLRKLNLYNATIYEAQSPNNGYCYIWNELNGKKGSDEVGTALYLWIKNLPEIVTEISIFTDTCGGQNRNQYLMCLLLYLVQKTNIQVIEQKYLESGHTHMEVDSMHSAIEHQLKNLSAFSMTDYCNIIKMARSNRHIKKGEVAKKPYVPVIMNFTDILDLKDLTTSLMKNRSHSTDGEKVQWLKVKCFRYEKNRPNIVLYRYDYDSNYKEIDVVNGIAPTSQKTKRNLRNRKPPKNSFSYDNYTLNNAYSHLIPITKAKKLDLIKMCTEKIIPSELHPWYHGLPDEEGIDYIPGEEDYDEDNS